MKTPVPEKQSVIGPDERSTGLPLFASWRSVYMFVVACFCVWVVILAILPRIFS
ncbi:MAG: hypothetical protein ACREJD_17665 [Phycisphaerales bacterium]